jgi:hypothetical protein
MVVITVRRDGELWGWHRSFPGRPALDEDYRFKTRWAAVRSLEAECYDDAPEFLVRILEDSRCH